MTTKEYEHSLLRMRPKMVSTATGFFHNREDAEDVVQEVYVRMLERGWHEGDDVEALCLRATKNLCVSVWRRQKLRETERLESVPERAARDTADTPLLRAEQQEGIERAINQLPPSEQRIVRMKMEDMSPHDIAQETGIPSRSISTMLWSAKKKLKQFIIHNS